MIKDDLNLFFVKKASVLTKFFIKNDIKSLNN